MISENSDYGIVQFQDPDRQSAHILSQWIQRSGVRGKTILEELRELDESVGQIGDKSFQQWTCDSVSSKLISGPSPEVRGARVIALLRWFIREHQHRSKPVILIDEMRQLINLYADIPVMYRLKLRRILHEFELHEGLRDPAAMFYVDDWRKQFAQWPVFGMVVDELWCIRATNVFDLELCGLHEADTAYWDWWHRLSVRVGEKKKFDPGSPFLSLRGPYSDIYHRYQMMRFKRIVTAPDMCSTPRCQALLELLMRSPGFRELWETSQQEGDTIPNRAVGVPIPFFRPEGTLLWMYEVSALIPGTNNYRLIVWSPVDENTSEYLAEIRRHAYETGRFSRRTFFIEDYASRFTPEERFALGVEE